MIIDELYTLVEAPFVETEQIGDVDLEPSETTFAQRLGVAEEEQSATKIITNVVEMRRDGVGTASEVKIVRQIEIVTKELKKVSTMRVCTINRLTARAISIL